MIKIENKLVMKSNTNISMGQLQTFQQTDLRKMNTLPIDSKTISKDSQDDFFEEGEKEEEKNENNRMKQFINLREIQE